MCGKVLVISKLCAWLAHGATTRNNATLCVHNNQEFINYVILKAHIAPSKP